MMEQPIAESFKGIPESYITEFKEDLGITFSYGTQTVTPEMHLIILAGVAVVLFALALLNARKKEA